MKRRGRNKAPWVILGVVLLLAAAGLIGYYILHSGLLGPSVVQTPDTESTFEGMPVPSLTPPVVAEQPSQTVGNPATDSETPASAQMAGAVAESNETGEIQADYVSPVDFEAAWAVNEDVIAWLYIPGIDMSYPIMMDPNDNTYYLTHDVQRNYSSAGALFIEDYNHPDFQDMCTVVYGHRMYDGDMFGSLQPNYTTLADLEKNQYIMVYLPDREICYQVFAAVPFDNSHILYYNDFDNQLSYGEFIDTIYSNSGIDGAAVEELEPEYGDRLLILSTCLWGDKDRRYLILAKELDLNAD